MMARTTNPGSSTIAACPTPGSTTNLAAGRRLRTASA
jgi:hypothetical protein